MTHVLLTNDDGVGAAGLAAVRAALIGAGIDVTVIAPNGERSGAGRAVTVGRPVDLERTDASNGHGVFSCTGTPVDCVRIGLFSNEFPPPDVVVTGINHGPNLGDDATCSGTVGAALEAALLGVPALALSQQSVAHGDVMRSDAEHRFEHAWLAPLLVRALAEAAPAGRVAICVNFPDELRDARATVTRPGAMTYRGRWMRPERRTATGARYWPYLGPDDAEPDQELDEGTDFAALAAGRISLTAVAATLGADGGQPDVAGWAWGLADAVTDALAERIV